MVISWNVKGLNKVAKSIEVKQGNAEKTRKIMGGMWSINDEYNKNANGRIWILWDDSRIEVRDINVTDQLIHYGVYNMDGSFINWLTIIYVSNKLEKRIVLWNDIENIRKNQQGPWSVMGNFNNVLGI